MASEYEMRFTVSIPPTQTLHRCLRCAISENQYLATLERFLEPLASGDLDQILDILPGLMNAVKMVHTIAR